MYQDELFFQLYNLAVLTTPGHKSTCDAMKDDVIKACYDERLLIACNCGAFDAKAE